MTGIVWGGGEMGAFVPSDGGVTETTANAGAWFDAAHARCSMNCGDGEATVSYAKSPVFTSLTTAWIHWSGYYQNNFGGGQTIKFVSLLDDSGVEQFYLGIFIGSPVVLRMFYWNGSAFVQIGTDVPITTNTLTDYDLNVVFGASGSAALYSAGTLVASGSASLTGLNCSQVKFWGVNTHFSGLARVSQCLASGQSTVGAKLTTAPITGAGLTESWTGVYTDVNEIVYNDANFISSGSAAQISNFAQATTVAQPINAVIVTARANVGSTGPQNLQLDLNVGATDYFSSTIAQSSGFSASVGVWLTNPATSAAWQASDWTSSVYYGVKSIT